MNLTLERVLSWNPCEGWTRERMLKMSGGREAMSASEIAAMDSISAEDRLWLLLRPEIIPARELRLLACLWAVRVLPIFEKKFPGDTRPREAIAMSRRFADGMATVEELAAARAAAWAAAGAVWDAAWAAAGAVWAAAGAAAGDAAGAAAGAVWAAAGDATWAAAGAAWAAQMRDVQELLAAMEKETA